MPLTGVQVDQTLCVLERVSPEIGLTSTVVVAKVIHDGKLVAVFESSYH